MYTREQLAALAAGATPESLGLAGTEPKAEDKPETKPEPTNPEPKAEDKTEPTPENKPEAKPETKPETKLEANAVVDFFKAQLAEANESIVKTQVQLAQLNAELTSMKATHEALVGIARSKVKNLLVATAGSPDAADTLDVTSLLAEHKRLDEVFKAKYPVGGVAGQKQEPTTKTQVDPRFLAAVKSVL